MIAALLILAAAAAAPRVGIVPDPCAELPFDGPPRSYMEWVVSTDPHAPLPARSAADAAAADAAQQAQLNYDWVNLCRYRAANAALPTDPQRVVFIGNSITEYWRIADPGLFAGHNVDRGISGQTTPQTLVRFMADVVALKPAVVHIWTGTNDIAGNGGPTTLQTIEDNIRAMVAIARANHIAVVLATVSPAKDFGWRPGLDPAPQIVALNRWLGAFAADNGCAFADYFTALSDGAGGMQPRYSHDGVHPNRLGYAAIRPIAERAIADAFSRR